MRLDGLYPKGCSKAVILPNAEKFATFWTGCFNLLPRPFCVYFSFSRRLIERKVKMGRKSYLAERKAKMNGSPCFYLPKELVTHNFSEFSTESKLLFSMIFTNAQHTKSIYEVAKLIEKISEKDLKEMRNQLLSPSRSEEGNTNV